MTNGRIIIVMAVHAVCSRSAAAAAPAPEQAAAWVVLWAGRILYHLDNAWHCWQVALPQQTIGFVRRRVES